MEKPEGYPEIIYPEDQTMEPIITKPAGEANSRFFWRGEANDMSFEFGDHDYYYSFEGLESLKRLTDAKVMAVIEFLRELFVRRKELLPQLQDQILEAVKKKGIRLWRVKSDNSRTRVTTMARSLSLGSPRTNEWIKIKTINTAAGDSSAGQGGVGGGVGAGGGGGGGGGAAGIK